MKLTEQERRAKYDAIRQSTQKQIRGVLTAAQQKKWDEMMKRGPQRVRAGGGRNGIN
jgi:hypothetical protein